MVTFITALRKRLQHLTVQWKQLRSESLKNRTGEKDSRGEVLLSMLGNMRTGMTSYARKPVSVMRDFLGMDLPFTVYRVSFLSGDRKRPDTLVFCLGKDEYGVTVTTDEVSTIDLRKIDEQIGTFSQPVMKDYSV